MSDTIVVISKVNLNLHTAVSKQYPTGLAHVQAMRATRVPVDVQAHPLFEVIQDDGTISVVNVRPSSKKIAVPLIVDEEDVTEASSLKPSDPINKPLEDEDEDEENEEDEKN